MKKLNKEIYKKNEIHLLNATGYTGVKIRACNFNGGKYNDQKTGEMLTIKPANKRLIKVTHIVFDTYNVTLPIIKDLSVAGNEDDLKYIYTYAFKYLTGRVPLRDTMLLNAEDMAEIITNAKDLKEVLAWCKNKRITLNHNSLYTSNDNAELITRCYRIAGENSHYYDTETDEIKNYDGAPIHFKVSRHLKKCNTCEKMIYGGRYKERKNVNFKPVFTYFNETNSYHCFKCVDGFKKCVDCLDLNPLNKENKCVACVRHDNTGVHEYGHRPKHFHFYYLNKAGEIISTPNPKNIKDLYFGFEYETEYLDGEGYFGDDSEYINDVAHDIKSELKQFRIYATSDSSLNSGFELHNHPTTFNALKKMDLKPMFRNDCSAWNDTAGLHVHLNRTAFSKLNLYKFCKFIYDNKTFSYFMANRYDNSQIDEYASFSNYFISDLKRNLSKKYNCFGDKYSAINMGQTKTIELRFFGGCDTSAQFLTKIEYIQSLFDFVKQSPINNNMLNYVGYVNANRKQFNNLHKTINTGAGRNAIKNATINPSEKEDY